MREDNDSPHWVFMVQVGQQFLKTIFVLVLCGGPGTWCLFLAALWYWESRDFNTSESGRLAARRCVTQMGRNGLFTRDEGLKGISVLCENVNENIMCK